MNKKINRICCGLLIAFSGILCSCDDSSKTIVVAASDLPHSAVLTDVIKPLVAAKGYDLEVKTVYDYVTPNTFVEDGSAFANYFQVVAYLNYYDEYENGDQTALCGVHYEPLGIYGGKKTELNEDTLKDAVVGIPNDVLNEPRALLLMQSLGYITLKDYDVNNVMGITVAQNLDQNPLNIDFEEFDASAVPDHLDSLDFGIVNGNYALQHSLGTALGYEQAQDVIDQYDNVVSVKTENYDDPRSQILIDAFRDPSVATYFEDNFAGVAIYNYLSHDDIYGD